MRIHKISVLVVDHSAIGRQVVADLLRKYPAIDVIDIAPNSLFAMDKMNRHWPDVVVLNIDMPHQEGITFIKKIMWVRPTPVVICSTLTGKSAETSLQAMTAGAVDIATIARIGSKTFLENDNNDLAHAVKAAAQANMRAVKVATLALQTPSPTLKADAMITAYRRRQAMWINTDRIVAIGASTGGVLALEAVLTALPCMSPGIVIVQHMPEKLVGAFAARLNLHSQIEVLEAKNGDRIIPGRALIAANGKHMTIKRSGSHFHVEMLDDPPVNRHRPSVDILFRSVAEWAGRHALGIIMTGIGGDGARGLKAMRDAGAKTAGQDEKSCIVYGMPKAAFKLGAVEQEISLAAIADLIKCFGKAG
jgi:two-component system chemotaxis response regulator CheB